MSTSSSKPRAREKRAPRSNEQEKLKTVVRRLPANLPEDIFWQSVHNWVSDDTVSWKVFYPGKLRKRLNKENVPSRAYIAFKTEEHLAVFSKEYDGHVFRDKAGNESQAVVEFAPYQKVPSDRKKQDARVGTIDKDEDYISFLASLQEPVKSTDLDTLELLAPSAQPQPEQKITPLLEALIAQKAAAKEKANQPPPTILAAKRDSKKAATTGTSTLTANVKPGHLASQKGDKTSGTAGKTAKVGNAPSKDGSASKSGVPGSSSKASLPARAQDAQTGGKKGSKRGTKASAEPSQSTSTSTAGPSSPPKQSPVKPKRERPSRPTAETNPATSPTVVAEASVASTSAGSSVTLNGEAPPARRVRPVIGLASRQFEAALGGAGIRARQARNHPETSDSTSASASANQAQPQELTASFAPASGRRGGRGGRTSPTVNRNASAAIDPSTIILQRIDDPGAELPPPPPAGFGGAEDANASSRGGRRGRGRARGGSTSRGG